MTYRTMPADIGIEKHLLGGALLHPDALAVAVENLQVSDFWDARHAVIWETLQKAHGRGEVLGVLGLEKALGAAGRLSDAGGVGYLMEISSEVVYWVGMEDHVTRLKGLGTRRRLIEALNHQMATAYDLTKTSREVMETAEAGILQVGETTLEGPGLKSMAQVLTEAAAEWEAVAKGDAGGVMTNLRPLDSILMGLRPGKYYVLAARPGLGKSMLALQIAAQCGAPVVHYSLEMLGTEQVERMVSQKCDLNSESLRSATVIATHAQVLHTVVKELKDLPIYFCDESPITPANILGQCRRIKKKQGLGLIIVDYLQLISGVGKFERRDLEVGSISKALKAISMKLQVPVLAIASLSRKPEERQDKRPIPSDLRESGSLESDADGVIFLYRESDYNPKAMENFKDVTEVIVAKNRGGRKGRALLQFDGAHSKFYELHPEGGKAYLTFINQKESDSHGSAQPRPYPAKVPRGRPDPWD